MNLSTGRPGHYLQETSAGLRLAVKLQPRASRNQIVGAQGAELKIAVTAPPVDRAANEALIELLAEALGTARSQIQLVRGQTSRHKTLLLTGLTAAEFCRRTGLG